jgi:hypothetical protein
VTTVKIKKTVDLKTKNRAYVEALFGVGNATNYHDFPDNYDPLDVIAEEAEFDLAKMMDKALDPVTGLPRDIRLPEGDFAEAKNYFDWCTNSSGIFVGPDDKIPFARQMWAATHLLAEYCPRCSHPKWNKDIFNLKVGTDPRKLPSKVAFLEYGVCPVCKVTKSELIREKELCNYVEGAWLWGQRAGKSTVTGSLANYVLHKYLKAPKMSSICDGIKASTPLTATFVGLRFADAMALLWEPITKGILDSPWFCLAEGTSISLADGTHKPIEQMLVGDEVKTLEGTSTVTNVFDNGVQECFDLTLGNGSVLTGTDKHQVRCLGADGASIVWKNIADITEDDFVLTE